MSQWAHALARWPKARRCAGTWCNWPMDAAISEDEAYHPSCDIRYMSREQRERLGLSDRPRRGRR